ncbi:hypothetical protein SUGI_0373660 [Cryptomeria japonica]|nr:hypothetical protein SUGI_0373660 [Cryptomeria japonica]
MNSCGLSGLDWGLSTSGAADRSPWGWRTTGSESVTLSARMIRFTEKTRELGFPILNMLKRSNAFSPHCYLLPKVNMVG